MISPGRPVYPRQMRGRYESAGNHYQPAGHINERLSMVSINAQGLGSDVLPPVYLPRQPTMDCGHSGKSV